MLLRELGVLGLLGVLRRSVCCRRIPLGLVGLWLRVVAVPVRLGVLSLPLSVAERMGVRRVWRQPLGVSERVCMGMSGRLLRGSVRRVVPRRRVVRTRP